MMGNVVGVFGEMYVLSECVGLDSNVILEMLSYSAMGSSFTTVKGKFMVDWNFVLNF